MRERHELEARRSVAMQLARLQEQERIGRRIDLSLTGRIRDIIASAQGLVVPRGDASDPQIRERLMSIETGAREALAELRALLGDLQTATPAIDEDPDPVVAAVPRRRIDVLLVVAAVPLAAESSGGGHNGGAAWLNVALSLVQGMILPLIRRRDISCPSPYLGSDSDDRRT